MTDVPASLADLDNPADTPDIRTLLPGAKCPESHIIEPDGVFAKRPTREDQDGKSRVAWAPLAPIRIYMDAAGDQLVELAWWDGRWVRRLVPRSVAKSGRKLVTQLGDAGLPVTDADSKLAERWLAAFEQVNRAIIPRTKIARQLGWQPDGEFVIADGSPYKVEPKYDEQRGALKAHREYGSLKRWQETIGLLAGYPATLPGLYGGLASTLLEPLGLDSFTVDISGRSTRGKTISVMCGASCWHDPDERSDGMFHWRTTMIAAEKRLNLVNGLPVVLDETRIVKSPDLIDQVLYQVPKNCGTPRGGGWPSMLPWRTIVLSTGEQPALSFTAHEGASARVLSVRKAPFGTSGEQSAMAAGKVREGVTANYGAAGPAFIRKLRAVLASEREQRVGRRALDEPSLSERHQTLTEKFGGQSDISGRRAPLVACLYLAGKLAHEWGVIPFAPPDEAAWLELFSDGDQARNDNRPEMALDIVREYLTSHQDKMFGAGAGEYAPATGWIGHEAKEGPALLPERVRDELKRRGYELDAVLPGWLEMKVLLTRDNQRPAYLIARRLGGRLTKHLIFKREVITPEDDDGQ